MKLNELSDGALLSRLHPDNASKIRVRYRAHRLHAEQVFGKRHVARQIHFRQPKWASKTPARRSHSEPPTEPTERPEPTESSEARVPTESPDARRELAIPGLVNLGFRGGEASHAVSLVCSRHSDGLPIPEILREALAVLTSKAFGAPRQ